LADGPEKIIQTEVMSLLVKNRYIVLRVGFDGLPDVIALDPDGEGTAWLRGYHRRSGCFPIKWKPSGDPSSRLFKEGLTLTTLNPHMKLCLELKKPGGVRNKRQEIFIEQLKAYSISMFVGSVGQVARLIGKVIPG